MRKTHIIIHVLLMPRTAAIQFIYCIENAEFTSIKPQFGHKQKVMLNVATWSDHPKIQAI